MRIKPGDIFGCSGRALESWAINLVTAGVPGWSLSHLAIAAEHQGRLLVFESTTNYPLPCAIQGSLVDGVQAHDPDEWLTRYAGRIWHYPLHRDLYRHESHRIASTLARQLGRPYDTIGAMRTGGICLSLVESMLRRADLSSIFCSELVAACHNAAGIFATSNVSRWNPNRLVRAERRAGVLQKPYRVK